MIILPNNRLILNGHRITNTKQLFEYLSKKFKTDINSKEDFFIFEKYKDLKIAIWHSWSFLEEENKNIHDNIIEELSKYWEIKQTWKH